MVQHSEALHRAHHPEGWIWWAPVGAHLIGVVQRGTSALTTALKIARANENATEGDGQANLGYLLQEAYRILKLRGQLKGRKIIEAKRLLEKRS